MAMSTTVYFEPQPEMVAIAASAFGYNGKKFRVRTANQYRLENYWSEGGIKHCVLVERDGLKLHAPNQGTTNPMGSAAHQTVQIPPGHFILEHSIQRGKDMGITFVVRPDEMDTAMLPATPDKLTDDEMIVLVHTKELKPSYGGVTNFRLSEAMRNTDITPKRWTAAKELLIEKKMLAKNGSITASGRNAAGTTSPFDLAYQLKEKAALPAAQ